MCVTVGLNIALLEARSRIEPLWAALQAVRASQNQSITHRLTQFATRALKDHRRSGRFAYPCLPIEFP